MNETSSMMRLFFGECQFPKEVLPPEVEAFFEKKSKILGINYGSMASSFLGMTAVALGGKKRIKLDDWEEKPILWTSLVGKSGIGKTTVLNASGMEVIQKWQDAKISQYRKDFEVWEALKENYDSLTANEKKENVSPREPNQAIQAYTSLTTIESILELNDAIESGVSIIADELATLLDGKNQYRGGAGNDQAILLQLFNSKGITQNLCGGKIRHLPDPHFCMVGGIQPALLYKIINKQNLDDGFASRVLPAFMIQSKEALHWRKKMQLASEITLSEKESIKNILLPYLEHRDEAKNFTFSEKAEHILREYHYELDVLARNSDPYLHSTIMKLCTYSLRLCLVLQSLTSDSEIVEQDVVLNSLMICDYFKGNIETSFEIVFAKEKENQKFLIMDKIRSIGEGCKKQKVQQMLRRHIEFKKCGEIIDDLVKSGELLLVGKGRGKYLHLKDY